MRRRLLVIVLTALVVAGCSQGSTSDTTATTGSTATTTSLSDTTETTDRPTSTSTALDGTSTTISDRPLAPDFTLELGDGGTYTLSEGSKPVYLVFWAEW